MESHMHVYSYYLIHYLNYIPMYIIKNLGWPIPGN